jgi:hypothetical protein
MRKNCASISPWNIDYNLIIAGNCPHNPAISTKNMIIIFIGKAAVAGIFEMSAQLLSKPQKSICYCLLAQPVNGVPYFHKAPE